MTKQDQASGDNSINIQAGGEVTINQGITYFDARQIAEDVYKNNFLKFAGVAEEIAKKRFDEITEAFLRKLKINNKDGVNQAKEPDFLYALFTVQKEYIRCGDKELGNLLVDLLVDRTKQPSRSILQIVLNESLSVAPKLTTDQLAALSIVFYFKYTVNDGLLNHVAFYGDLDKYIQPFVNLLEKKSSCYQHLEYSGCGRMTHPMFVSLEKTILNRYSGLFSIGFDEAQYLSKKITIPFTHPIFKECLNDPSKKQIIYLNEKNIKEDAEYRGVSAEDVYKLIALQREHIMNEEMVRKAIVSARPYMEKVFDTWKEALGYFTLTSVGIAIGHANIKKNVGEFTDLSIWIS